MPLLPGSEVFGFELRPATKAKQHFPAAEIEPAFAKTKAREPGKIRKRLHLRRVRLGVGQFLSDEIGPFEPPRRLATVTAGRPAAEQDQPGRAGFQQVAA